MKLSAAFSIVFDLITAIRIAFLPTLKAILASPSLLCKPHALSRLFMANIWEGGFGKGTDENARPVKASLIPFNAHGVVLDVGAGIAYA